MKLTQTSVDLVKHISNNMESHTFHHHFHILYDIRTSLGNRPINYLEIGAFAGASACLMSLHNYPTNCYSIDIGTFVDPNIVKRNVANYKKDHNTWEFIHGSSHDPKTLEIVKNQISEIDLLFIDGDHSYEAVIKDFELYKDLVVPGGYIVFDDYFDWRYSPQVRHAVDHIVNNTINFNLEFEVIGTFKNVLKAHPSNKEDNNEFILRKK
jgi:predicted O-methyltransferase YrrM